MPGRWQSHEASPVQFQLDNSPRTAERPGARHRRSDLRCTERLTAETPPSIARTAKSGVTTFSIKFRDADGRQAWERLGTDAEGWTRPKAKAELEARLVDVQREGLRRPAETTVADVAREWLAVYPTTKTLKRSTATSYESIVENYIVPLLGHLRIDALDVGVLDRYVAERLAEGLAPATVNRQLNVLSLIVRSARKRKLLRENPVELVDRPREPRRRWRILDPAEIARVQTALASSPRRPTTRRSASWIEQARVVFTVVYGIGLRRGEVLGLRWRHVRLADPAGPTLRVEETFVRNRIDTPKSTPRRGRSRSAASSPRRSSSSGPARPTTPTTIASSATCRPAARSTTSATPTRSGRRSRRPGSPSEVRPFHDGRHTSITNAAAAGVALGRCRPAPDTPTSRRRSATSTSPGSSSATRPSSPRLACSGPPVEMSSTDE